MRHALAHFIRDRRAAVLPEFAIVGPLVIILVLATIEMAVALWAYNSTAKAAQLGARLAAVSAPVSSDLSTLTGLGSGAIPGGAMPYFVRTCSGETAQCSNGGVFSQAALDWIVRGPDGACGTSDGRAGMCDIFAQIEPENVSITYEQTGLGFAGRPGGPVPSITVSVSNIDFDTPLLRTIAALVDLQMPTFRTTVTSEDLRSGSP